MFAVRRISSPLALTGGAFAVLLLLACSREAKPTPEAQSAAATKGVADEGARVKPVDARPPAAPEGSGEPAGSGAPAPAAGAARYDEANYAVSLEDRGPYQAGKRGTVDVVLEAKRPFKVNQEYPVRFRLSGANGLDAPEVVRKDKAKIDKAKLVLPVAFTPESAGKKRLVGTLHFSVCTKDKCLMEQKELSLGFDVK